MKRAGIINNLFFFKKYIHALLFYLHQKFLLGRTIRLKSCIMLKRIPLVLLILLTMQLDANPITKSADDFYAQNQFENAAEEYEILLKKGYNHDDIHYNLGNSYYRLNQIGKAILHYEKAVKINPLHQDAAYNLKLANLKVASKITPIADFIFIKWWKSLYSIFVFNTWAYISIGWVWMALLGLITYLFSSQSFLKKTGFFSAIFCISLALFSYILGYSNKSNAQSTDYGIVLINSYYAKSEPTDKGKELFALKEGMKVKQIDIVGKWVQISLSDGNKGWVEQSILAYI